MLQCGRIVDALCFFADPHWRRSPISRCQFQCDHLPGDPFKGGQFRRSCRRLDGFGGAGVAPARLEGGGNSGDAVPNDLGEPGGLLAILPRAGLF